MDIRYFELRAANKDCKEKFSDVAKKKYAGVPIFEHACNYVNNSQSVTDLMSCHGFAHMNCHQIDWFSVISQPHRAAA